MYIYICIDIEKQVSSHFVASTVAAMLNFHKTTHFVGATASPLPASQLAICSQTHCCGCYCSVLESLTPCGRTQKKNAPKASESSFSSSFSLSTSSFSSLLLLGYCCDYCACCCVAIYSFVVALVLLLLTLALLF